MSYSTKPYGLALLVSVLVSACATTPVDTAQQVTQNEQAALEMIASTLNAQCSNEGLIPGSTEHAECFWQHAAKLREQLTLTEGNRRQIYAEMNSAKVIADRKYRTQDNYVYRRARENREEQRIREDRSL